jgi:hypothetical protein
MLPLLFFVLWQACLRSSEAVVEEKDLIAGLWAKLGGLLAAGFDTVVHEIRCAVRGQRFWQ